MRTASLPLLLDAGASASAHAAAAVLIADTENHLIRRYTPGTA